MTNKEVKSLMLGLCGIAASQRFPAFGAIDASMADPGDRSINVAWSQEVKVMYAYLASALASDGKDKDGTDNAFGDPSLPGSVAVPISAPASNVPVLVKAIGQAAASALNATDYQALSALLAKLLAPATAASAPATPAASGSPQTLTP